MRSELRRLVPDHLSDSVCSRTRTPEILCAARKRGPFRLRRSVDASVFRGTLPWSLVVMGRGV